MSMMPLIDEEFLMGHEIARKKRAPLDEKGLKRKIKAEEKMMIRELKKDTAVIQNEKAKRKTQRVSKYKKAAFRGGNGPKDEF